MAFHEMVSIASNGLHGYFLDTSKIRIPSRNVEKKIEKSKKVPVICTGSEYVAHMILAF